MNEVVNARADAALKRQRFFATVHKLQDRLKPANIASDVVESAKAHGREVTEEALDLAHKMPVVSSAVGAGAIALLGFGILAQLRRKKMAKRVREVRKRR